VQAPRLNLNIVFPPCKRQLSILGGDSTQMKPTSSAANTEKKLVYIGECSSSELQIALKRKRSDSILQKGTELERPKWVHQCWHQISPEPTLLLARQMQGFYGH
jgi:hypothetical protein